jgi:hypothetical protein
MFLGHFAVALAASRAEPRLRLGAAFVAAQLPDVLWPAFLLAGLERVTIAPGDTAFTPLRFDSYPWSHSLVLVIVWGLVAAGLYATAGGARRAALWIAPLAVSHWLLDALSHRPDMPLLPRAGPLVGLGLWNSITGTLVVEGALFATAVWLFARGRRLGAAFWSLIAFLVLVYVANLFGPPPPSARAIGLSMLPVTPALWWWANRATRADTDVD